MGEAAKKDEDEEKLIPVGPGAEGLPEAEREKDDDTDAEAGDERLAQKREEDEPDDGSGTTARKKESAKERRERAKKTHARDRTERDFLLRRNEDLEKRLMAVEGRTAQTETAAIDQRINTINAQLSNADRVLAEALRKPNGAGADEFVEAQRIRDQLRDQLSELSTSKKSHQQATQRVQREREVDTGKPDARVIRNAREWASQHDWFDFTGNDEDSVIVRAIDEALAGEGYDPTSDEYWDELSSRVKRRLPEKFKGGARARADDDDDAEVEDERPRKNAGPKFSSGGRERPLKKGEVYVSAERKQAMKDYGAWEDPVLRSRMLKRYAAWDETHPASKS